jgi:hypothetical protein
MQTAERADIGIPISARNAVSAVRRLITFSRFQHFISLITIFPEYITAHGFSTTVSPDPATEISDITFGAFQFSMDPGIACERNSID